MPSETASPASQIFQLLVTTIIPPPSGRQPVQSGA
jgi:hypothetical protein